MHCASGHSWYDFILVGVTATAQDYICHESAAELMILKTENKLPVAVQRFSQAFADDVGVSSRKVTNPVLQQCHGRRYAAKTDNSQCLTECDKVTVL
jgi:hypothetical protein